MHERPKVDDLLECARSVLAEDILPKLGGEERYAVLMVMNAMGIAARHASGRDEALATSVEELKLLSQRVPGALELTGVASRPEASEEELLEAAHHELCRAIEDGVFDEERARSALQSYLEHDVRARLALANPKALARVAAQDAERNT